MLALLATLVLSVPDAGAFADSALGQKRAGENVAALDERWVEGLAAEPLLARVERHGDELAVAFYAARPSPDAGAAIFEEKARFAVPMARQLVGVELRKLGSAGPLLAVTASADDPDEEPVAFAAFARGPKQVLAASFLRDVSDGTAALSLGGPEGYSFRDGGSDVEEASGTKRVKLQRPDGGAVEVALGQRQRVWRWRGDAYAPGSDAYRDFLQPLKLVAKGHGKLVDGKPTTSEKLAVGTEVALTLPTTSSLRMLRLVPGCLENETRSARDPAVTELQVQLDDSAPIDVRFGQPVADTRLFGAGEFTLGKGYGTSELLVFDPAIAASRISVKPVAATGGASAGCLAEIAAY